MPRVAQGGFVTLQGNVGRANGYPADAPDLTLVILDTVGDPVAGFPVDIPPIMRVDLGVYTYAWAVPIDLAIGDYVATWEGTVDGAPAGGSETVEVVPPGAVDAGPLDILLAGDYDSIRAMLGVDTIDVEDDIINLPAYGPYIEARVKELVPDWATVNLDAVASLFLRAAVRYGVAAELAESYVKGGTVSLVHKEEPRRNWSEWARIFWLRYEEALARVTTSGIPDDDFDLPTGTLSGPTRSRGNPPDWTGVYPPVWPE